MILHFVVELKKTTCTNKTCDSNMCLPWQHLSIIESDWWLISATSNFKTSICNLRNLHSSDVLDMCHVEDSRNTNVEKDLPCRFVGYKIPFPSSKKSPPLVARQPENVQWCWPMKDQGADANYSLDGWWSQWSPSPGNFETPFPNNHPRRFLWRQKLICH